MAENAVKMSQFKIFGSIKNTCCIWWKEMRERGGGGVTLI